MTIGNGDDLAHLQDQIHLKKRADSLLHRQIGMPNAYEDDPGRAHAIGMGGLRQRHQGIPIQLWIATHLAQGMLATNQSRGDITHEALGLAKELVHGYLEMTEQEAQATMELQTRMEEAKSIAEAKLKEEELVERRNQDAANRALEAETRHEVDQFILQLNRLAGDPARSILAEAFISQSSSYRLELLKEAISGRTEFDWLRPLMVPPVDKSNDDGDGHNLLSLYS